MENKIIEIETKDGKKSEEIPKNNYKTFNRLIKLQKLIKKESILKELCKYKK